MRSLPPSKKQDSKSSGRRAATSVSKRGTKTVMPLHDELARGTLLAILKQCGLSRDELLALLKRG